MGRDFVGEIQQAILVDEKTRILADMKRAVDNMRTPAELLLNQVAPSPAPDDAVLFSQVREALGE
ncbi:MAG: hypothetical protein ACK5P7_06195 [Bdellovibrio sp.]